ncbi:hypothetical protein DSUL_160004 [Desulfovibrionales bacterium]
MLNMILKKSIVTWLSLYIRDVRITFNSPTHDTKVVHSDPRLLSPGYLHKESTRSISRAIATTNNLPKDFRCGPSSKTIICNRYICTFYMDEP